MVQHGEYERYARVEQMAGTQSTKETCTGMVSCGASAGGLACLESVAASKRRKKERANWYQHCIFAGLGVPAKRRRADSITLSSDKARRKPDLARYVHSQDHLKGTSRQLSSSVRPGYPAARSGRRDAGRRMPARQLQLTRAAVS